MNDTYIIIGKLGRSRGLQGEIYITPVSDDIERFLELDEIFVKKKSEWKKFEIIKTTLIGKRPVVKLKGVNNPENAAAFTNREIALLKEDLEELPEESFYIFDIVGCEVKCKDSDETIGEIIDVEQYPANDVYLIKTTTDEEIRFPAVKHFVESIDIEKKLVLIDKAGLIS